MGISIVLEKELCLSHQLSPASKDSSARKLHTGQLLLRLCPTPLDDSAYSTTGEAIVLGLSFSLALLGGPETPT